MSSGIAFGARVLVGALAMTLVACGGQPPEGTTGVSTHGVSRRSYDGATLFRAIMLGSGEAADVVPFIRDHLKTDHFITDKAQLRKVNRAHEQIVSMLLDVDREFIPGFKAAVESGDHLAIDRATREAGPIMMRAILQMDAGGKLARALENPAEVSAALKRHTVENGCELSAEKAVRAAAALQRLIAQTKGLLADEREELLPPLVYAVYWAVYAVVAAEEAAAVNVHAVVNSAADVALAIDQAVKAKRGLYGPNGKVTRREQLIDSIATTFVPAS